MGRFRLCAAAMAMVITGAFAFPSQAGVGVMVIGGNCSTGQGWGTSGKTGNAGGWNNGSGGSGCGTGGWNNSSGGGCSAGGWNNGFNGGGWNAGGWNNGFNGNNCNTGNVLPGIIFGNNQAGVNGGISSSCPVGTITGGNSGCLPAICPEGTSQGRPDICIPGTDEPETSPAEETRPAPDDPEETRPAPDDTEETKPVPDVPEETRPAPDNPEETRPDAGNPGGTGSGGNHTTGGGSGITRPDGSQNGGNITGDDSLQEGSQARTYIRQVIALVNEERARAGLSPVTESAKVSDAAALRAREITGSFSHTRPDGTGFSTALRQSGVSFSGSGENIAYGQPSPQAVMDTWMNSPTHRANILNSRFTNIGVGCYIDGRGVIYWTQLFTY